MNPINSATTSQQHTNNSYEVMFSNKLFMAHCYSHIANQSALSNDTVKTMLSLAIKEFNLFLHESKNVIQIDQSQLIDATNKLINCYGKIIKIEINDRNFKDAKSYLKIAHESYKYLKNQAPESKSLIELHKSLFCSEIAIAAEEMQQLRKSKEFALVKAAKKAKLTEEITPKQNKEYFEMNDSFSNNDCEDESDPQEDEWNPTDSDHFHDNYFEEEPRRYREPLLAIKM